MRMFPNVDVAFVFGPFKLIPSQQVLLRENRPVKLGGRALDVLHLLVMRAGEEVSKGALIKFAWPNVFVDERNLKVHISSLRRALEDTSPQATYIATVVGHGYQFVAQVRKEQVEVADLAVDDQFIVVGSLPPRSPLIGRQRDVEGIARALDFTKLVTLVGPGGVGKTSLAIAVAHARCDEFPDGVHFVDISSTDDPAFVPHLVATSVGVRGHSADLISDVVEYLKNKRILIVLDNCEHLLHAVATVASRLVETNIGSRILVTSRAPLGVIGENIQRVEPLAFPQRADVRSPGEALAYPAVALFAVRALETAEYQLLDDDAYVIASLCEALDGLPLAIEIAAAKLDQFAPAELLKSFGRRLGELRNEDNAAHFRHQTLWAMLDWSYQLLSRDEATIFRLLSVFAGPFEWTDVASMAQLTEFDPYQTTVALGGLVSKSLLSAEIDGERLRYRLLESTKGYASEKLLQDPIAHEAQHHHAQLVLSVFKKSGEEWACVDYPIWRARYGARVGELRKALDWCFNYGGNASLGVDLAISAIRLWDEQSTISEQLSQVERALHHCLSITDAPRQQAALATSRAWTMTFAGQLHADTDNAWYTARDFAELSGDVGQHLSVMCGQAVFLVATGRHEQALNLANDITRIAAQAGDRALLFDGERLGAWAEMYLGKLVDAQAKVERLAEQLAHGMPSSRITRYQTQRYVNIYGTLALTSWLTGQPGRALAIADEMVLETGQIGQLMGQSNTLAVVALPLSLWSGQIDALERYSTMLRGSLDREDIAIWAPVHEFYASVCRHAGGDVSAVEDMRLAVDKLVRDRFLVRTPMYLGVLAEALLERGRLSEADDAVELALTLQRQTKENWCRAELLRVKAQILAALGEQSLASRMLTRARENALAIGAQSLELRIVNDMAQMAIVEGNNAGAVELLAGIINGFGEITATEDLKRCARLLIAADANWPDLQSKLIGK